MNNDVSKKKKTSKEKRILIASLCIAAAVLAGSTFAWFTSNDEVTNRLSANADYNVSIVESFEPPANWIPGQEINKDVYAVNTGSIPAFVQEEVSGVLTLTQEEGVVEFNANCVQLTPAERYVMEAGSYLAYKPAGSSAVLGNKIVSMTPDPADLNGYTAGATDFTPDAEGLYVFRRSIVVDGSLLETFEYEGYYYKDNKFYKITDLEVTPDATPDLAGDGVNTDGNLTGATFKYVQEAKHVIDPVALAYDEDTNSLIATYDTGISPKNSLEALAAAYDEALREYEVAAEAVNRATNDANGVGGSNADLTAKKAALDAAYATLQTELADQRDAQSAYNTALAAKNAAQAKKDAAQAAEEASRTKLYGSSTGTDASTATAGSLKGKYNAATADKAAAEPDSRDQFLADFNDWTGTAANTSGKTSLDAFTYEEFAAFTPDDINYEYYSLVAAEKLAKEAYEAELTKLIGGTDPTVAATPTSLVGKNNTAEDELTTAEGNLTTRTGVLNTANDDLDDAQGAYDDALADYNAALTANNINTRQLDEATAALAVATAKKNAAQTAYNDAITAGVGTATSELKINIKLSDNVVTAADGTNDKWQILPSTVAGNKAIFYYTGILEGSETSSKLIDSVELDSSATQDMYKSFDFDLNVALKSAQITYGPDDETILADPATSEFGKTPTMTNDKDLNTALIWN